MTQSILEGQRNTDHVYRGIENTFKNLSPIPSAEADEKQELDVVKKNLCYRPKIVACRHKFLEHSRQLRPGVDRAERYEVRKKIFLPCQAEVDRACGIERRPWTFPLSTLEETRSSYTKQVTDLLSLARQISSRVIFVPNPFANPASADPGNMTNMNSVTPLPNEKLESFFFEDEEYFRFLVNRNLNLTLVLREQRLEHIDLQAVFEQAAVNEDLFWDFGHVTENGHRIVAQIILETLKKHQAQQE